MKHKLLIAGMVVGLLGSGPVWADQTINQLSAGGALSGTELIPMFQTANPAVTTTPNALKTFITTSPVLVTPNIGVATGTSIALGSPTGSTGTGDINISGAFKINGTPYVTSSGQVTLNTSSLIETLPNDTVTGTTASKLVVDTGGKVINATTAQGSSVIGICVSGISGTSCGTSGNASIAIAGQATCVFDGATTAGDFFTASGTVAGDCTDVGATVPQTSFVVGNVLTTNGAGGTYAVDISPIGPMAALNSKSSPGGTSGQIQYNSSGKFGGFTMGGDCTFSQPNITCTKTSGVAFAASATTDTTSASNISSGTLSNSRLSGVGLLATAESWTKAQRGTPVNIAISTSTFTPNFDNSQNFEIDLTSACPCTLANPSTTLVAGQSGIIEIHQDGSGSRTIGTYGTDYLAAGGTSTITLSTAASSVDYLPYYVNNAATGIVLGALIKGPTH